MSEKEPFLYTHFPMLNGIRGISILWVVIHHIPAPLPEWLEFLRVRGDLGVELFFAVSGFLVTRSLYQSQIRGEGRVGFILKDFFIRRVSRIFPPYYLTLIVLGLIALFIDQSLLTKLKSISEILWSFPMYFYNYMKWSTEGTIPGTLNVMWSLAFEEQFYIILIGSFLLFRKNFAKALLSIALLSIAYRLTLSFFNPEGLNLNQLQFQIHLRFDAIAWGCFAWIGFSSLERYFKKNPWHLKVISLFVPIGVGVTVVMHHWMHTLLWESMVYVFSAIFFTALVLYICLDPGSLLARALSFRPLAYIGVISYEIYLVHEIVVGGLIRFGLKQYPAVYVLAVIICSIIGAALFFHLFSQPTQKWLRKKWSPH